MRKSEITLFWLLVSFFCVLYLFTQTKSIYGGDAGDLVTAAYIKGIAHPPGYPLYIFIGWLLTKLPIGTTIAWRVGLLSSIPQAFSVGFSYLLFNEIFKKKLIPFIGSLILGFLYPIWLYAVVPEVFALNNFFVILISYLMIKWFKKKKEKFIYIASFVFGLALAHHHTIILLIPSMIYLFYKFYKKVQGCKKINIKKIAYCLILFLLGLLPYIYLPLTAKNNPPINWGNPINFRNFIRVITREDYGTFTIGPYAQISLKNRLLDLIGFTLFVFNDFRFLGTILILIGFLKLLKSKSRDGELNFFWLSNIFLQLFFIFYSGFPLNSDFITGTFERFIIVPYFFLLIPLLFGITKASKIFAKFLIDKIPSFQKLQKKTFLLVEMLFLVYPLSLFYLNLPKISILKNDLTAEKFGEDVIQYADRNAIIIIGGDTALFNTQYVYYVNKLRPDVKLLQLQKLQYHYYLESIKKYYPELIIPDTNSTQFFLNEFIVKNAEKFPVYLREPLIPSLNYFYPEGLLFRYYSQTPDLHKVIEKNEEVWQKLQDPLSGSLGRYKNLIIADVLRAYSLSLQEAGILAFKNGRTDLAEKYFQKAIKYYPQDADFYIYLGQVNLHKKECENARNNFLKAVEIYPGFAEAYKLLTLTYRSCFNDEDKAKEYELIYNQLIKTVNSYEATQSGFIMEMD